LGSLPYTASIVCEPNPSEVVVQVAIPVVGVTGIGDPHSGIGLPPSVKVTAPESSTGPVIGVTVAVKVTVSLWLFAFLTTEGFSEDTSAVADAAAFTVCISEVLLLLKLVSLA
jgi:hypothetical protein